MKTTKKEELIVELISSLHQLKKRAFESIKSSFSDRKLSYIHWRLLSVLKNAGKKYPGELAKELGISPSAVSQYVNGLLKEKLVTIEVSRDDRRLRQVMLTRKGENFINNCREKSRRAIELQFANLTKEEIETLLKIFRKLLK